MIDELTEQLRRDEGLSRTQRTLRCYSFHQTSRARSKH